MDNVELFLYARCSSCRNAEQLLSELGISATRRDFFRDPFKREELIVLLNRMGLTVQDVLATRSRPYKALDLAHRTLTDDELIDLMIEYPQLLKRPLIVRNGHAIAGFNRSAIEALVRE